MSSVLLNPYSFATGGAALPVTSGLFAWYDVDSFSGTTWSDKTGNGRHGIVTRGSVSVVNGSGNGGGTFPRLTGGTGDTISFPTSVLPPTYTVFHTTRYRGGTYQRILCSIDGNNWLNGHWGGGPARAHHNGWVTYAYNGSSYGLTDWIVSAGMTDRYWANGRIEGFSGGGGGGRIGVNGGSYGEYSDWECAEVIVYDRRLTDAEVADVNSWLMTKYGLRQRAGLALSLNAADPASYSGTGGTWLDTSGNGRHFSIGGGISWNPAGYFQVSGGTFTGPAANSFYMANEFTLEIWLKVDAATYNTFTNWPCSTDDGNGRSIFSHHYYANGNTYFDSGGCCGGDTRISYGNDGDWTAGPRRYVIRRQAATPHRMIMKNNSVAVDSGGNGTAKYGFTGGAATIGGGWQGRIYEVALWDRALSDTELTARWDARRGVYGL